MRYRQVRICRDEVYNYEIIKQTESRGGEVFEDYCNLRKYEI